MPYIFVGFDICHQSHSRRYLALLLWFYGRNAYKKKRAILQNIAKWHGAF